MNAPPRATPAVLWVSVLLALLLVALGVVTVRDLAVAQGWASGSTWVAGPTGLVDGVGGLSASTWLAVVGGAVALVGLALVVLAVRPGRRTHVPLGRTGSDATDAWVTPAAVAALARGVADRSSGVLAARADKVSRRRITVSVAAAGDSSSAAAGAQADVDRALAALPAPPVSVRARKRTRAVAS